MHEVYLIVGGNQANTASKYEQLFALLNEHAGRIIAKSPFYESPAWGFESEYRFVNMALCLQTDLSPSALLEKTQMIEQLLGRTKTNTTRYEDRSMDIDIIFYDNIVLQTDCLQIPHAQMHLRNFVLTPLSCISPLFVHPVFKKNIVQLQKECPDKAVLQTVTMV